MAWDKFENGLNLGCKPAGNRFFDVVDGPSVLNFATQEDCRKLEFGALAFPLL
jgi:hypothetical protein